MHGRVIALCRLRGREGHGKAGTTVRRRRPSGLSKTIQRVVIIDPATGSLGRLKRGRWQWGGHEIAGVIQATHLHGSPAKNGGPVPESSRRRGFFAAAAAPLSAVRLAKRAADEKPCVRRAGADGAAGDTAARRAVRGSRGHDRDFHTGRTGAHLSKKNVIMVDKGVTAGAVRFAAPARQSSL